MEYFLAKIEAGRSVFLGVENIRLDLNSTTCMWRAGTLTHNDPNDPEPCRYGHVWYIYIYGIFLTGLIMRFE